MNVTAQAEDATAVPTRVLVLGMAREDGTIDAAELLPVATACGQSAEQVRSCLRRLVAEGLFERQGSGRHAIFRATERGITSLSGELDRTRLAYGQDAAGRGWDGQWRLIALAVPESRRGARDALRDRMRALGGAPIQGGLHVSPHPWHADVMDEAERLGIASGLTVATTSELRVGGVGDPRELARSLWPVEDLAARYHAFCEQFADVWTHLLDMRADRRHIADADFLPGALRMAVGYQACFRDDPLLPPELLPRPWPGRSAREIMRKTRRMAVVMRSGPGRPALFRTFDDAIDALR
ncbi:MAG: transcriptional regulator [Acidimicrobiales bacterium]